VHTTENGAGERGIMLISINPGLPTLFTIVACLYVLVTGQKNALLAVAVASFIGTYAIGGGDGEGIKLVPGPLVAMTFLGGLLLRSVYNGTIRIIMFPGAAAVYGFLAYAALMTVLGPLIFGGKVLVVPPGGFVVGEWAAVGLRVTTSTFAQIIYLTFSMLLLVIAAKVARRNESTLSSVVNFHITAGVVFASFVVLDAVVGAAGFKLDLVSWIMRGSIFEPPTERYSLLATFGIPIKRGQSVFGEPSFFATYLNGVLAALLLNLKIKATLVNTIKVFMVSAALILAFSTTATVGFIIISLCTLMLPIKGASHEQTANSKFARLAVISIVAILTLILIYIIFTSDFLFDYIFGKFSDTEGYEDGNQASGAVRLYWDVVAFGAFVDSWGLGIGAGGTRASSFLLNTAAAYGVIGVAVVLSGVTMVWKILFGSLGRHATPAIRPGVLLFAGWLFGLIVSVSDGFLFFYVWIHLGFLIGALSPLAQRQTRAVRQEAANLAGNLGSVTAQ
jgi:hypothetical protein